MHTGGMANFWFVQYLRLGCQEARLPKIYGSILGSAAQEWKDSDCSRHWALHAMRCWGIWRRGICRRNIKGAGWRSIWCCSEHGFGIVAVTRGLRNMVQCRQHCNSNEEQRV